MRYQEIRYPAVCRRGQRSRRLWRPVGAVGLHLANVLMHPGALMVQVLGDCAAEPFVRQPVGRQGLCRQEAARHLVLTLGPGFETCQAMPDAEFLALVIAGLEVQLVELL